MRNEDYAKLNSEISDCQTVADVVRMRDRILTYPDDDDRMTLFRSLVQHAADVDILIPAEGAGPTVEPR